jgi:hypothetical protein
MKVRAEQVCVPSRLWHECSSTLIICARRAGKFYRLICKFMYLICSETRGGLDA